METFERKAYEKLASWKDSSQGSTALLIEGARRVGKSTIADNQANRHGQLALNMIGIVLAILCVITGLWHQQTVGWEESKVLLIISFVFAFTHLGFYMVRIWKQTTKVF